MNTPSAGREAGPEGGNPSGKVKVPAAAYVLPALSVAAPLAAPFAWRYGHGATLSVMGTVHAAYLYGSLRANSRMFGPVATRFAPVGNEVWLTVDDGPTPEDTPRLLDLLDAAGARATFFVRGDSAEKYPGLIRDIVGRGHGVANHTYSHPQYSFWCAPPRKVASEIDRCGEVLREITGCAPVWFRAPVGMSNPFVHRIAAARGLRLVGWSDRGLDTLPGATAATVVRRILHGLRPGGTVLLHEGRRGRGGERINVQAARALLAVLSARDWRAVIPADAQLR